MAENKVVYTNNSSKVMFPNGQHFWAGRSTTAPPRIAPRSTVTTQLRTNSMGALKFATEYVDSEQQISTARKFIVAFDIAAPQEDGPYGSQWSRSYSMILGEDERIKEVIVRHGHIGVAIGFVVADKTGRTSTKMFGDDGGSRTKILVRDDEYITQISGTYGDYRHFDNNNNKILIATIAIHTNLNPLGYGPYGRAEQVQNPRNFATASGLIDGFFGRHNDNLESIGIYSRIGNTKEYGPYGSELARNYSMILGPDDTIKEIIVRHGFIVDAIGFVIAAKSGSTSTKIFGGESGNTTRVSLKSDEYITQVSGTQGEYRPHNNITLVGTITIHTNLNPSGYGPYGTAEQVLNHRTFASGRGPIDGFFGRHNNYLESIGISMSTYTTNKEYGPYGSELARNYSRLLREDESIKEVIVRHGFIVDAIGFVIAAKNGSTSTEIFGGNSGDDTRLLLKSDEYITQISGTHGPYYDITSLIGTITIHTNLNPGGYGPYGRAEQVQNPRAFVTGRGFINGFFGRRDNYLESIGIRMSTNAANKAYVESGPVGPTDWNSVEVKLDQSSDVSVDNNLGGKVEVNVSHYGNATAVFSATEFK